VRTRFVAAIPFAIGSSRRVCATRRWTDVFRGSLFATGALGGAVESGAQRATAAGRTRLAVKSIDSALAGGYESG
jgi:hypothetical protein